MSPAQLGRLARKLPEGVRDAKGTREGKGGRGGGYRFTPEDIDAWDATRTKRAPKGSKKRMGEQYAAATAMDPAKQANLEAAGWKAGSAEDFLSAGGAADEESDWDRDCSQGEFGPE